MKKASGPGGNCGKTGVRRGEKWGRWKNGTLSILDGLMQENQKRKIWSGGSFACVFKRRCHEDKRRGADGVKNAPKKRGKKVCRGFLAARGPMRNEVHGLEKSCWKHDKKTQPRGLPKKNSGRHCQKKRQGERGGRGSQSSLNKAGKNSLWSRKTYRGKNTWGGGRIRGGRS